MSIGPIMLDVQGFELTAEDRELLQHPMVGGVIFFTRNYHDKAQLKNLVAEIRSSRDPILLAVDQEGGRVQRFKNEFAELPPLGDLGKDYDINPQQALANAREMAMAMAQEVLEVGIDFSFAPVLDVDLGISKVIGDRSFHSDANAVCDLAMAYIAGMKEVGMSAVGKHYPGHGSVSVDSHDELPEDVRDIEIIADQDLIPFQRLASILPGIMSAHILYSEIDDMPAGFSFTWLQSILRDLLKFEGAIFSDCLSMGGASGFGSYSDRCELAHVAGCDMMLICNNREGAIEALDNFSIEYDPLSQKRLQRMQGRVSR